MQHRIVRRAPGGRGAILVAVALALVALLFNYLGGAVAGASPASQPTTTPLAAEATPTAAAGDELPAAARAVLDAYLATTGGASLASLDDAQLPQGLQNSFTYIHLPALAQANDLGGGPPPPTEVPTEEPDPETADVAVTLWPDPSIRVVHGGNFIYDIRVRNHGRGSANQVTLSLPYRRDQLTLTEARLDSSKGDWVREIGDTTITIVFGRLAPNTERTGRLIFRAAGNLPNDTIIDMRATYRWSDQGDGGADRRSNWAPLLVGQGNASAPWVWTAISQTSGPAWTIFRVQSNRFIPGEPVVTWLNTPRGVQALDLRGTADNLGAIVLNFQDTRLPAGDYSIVLYGQRSGLTGVASFRVTP